MRSPDLITFGETMALFMPSEDKGLERASQLLQGFGGAESNVAIGVARLGGSVGWFGSLGADPFGTMIYKTLRGEGVDTSQVKLVEGESTGLMFRERVAGRSAVHYYRKLSAASKIQPQDLDEAYIRNSKLLHVTGITAALSSSSLNTLRRSVEIAKSAGVKISFDPNLRLKLWPLDEARAALLPLAAEADYFLPGWDELQLLYETDHLEVVLEKLSALKAVSVIKGVGEKTIILDKGVRTEVPFFPAKEVVDTVGAGDAFCAGFLYSILKGMSAVEAVKVASISGSLAVQMKGDWEALPVWSTVEQQLGNKAWVER
ncbi:sugar kinase [Paenibacillus sp. GCM10012307]|uniref:Sugar kinase n=1 Tax=Paenibacillus roseus TaxID=2798579 RepID=A0A934MQM1_9BACL|nr:sugar kinase [Paenibacillus roseus]MBJ6362033.1 sugar kinase [Paenibacillus roseus]